MNMTTTLSAFEGSSELPITSCHSGVTNDTTTTANDTNIVLNGSSTQMNMTIQTGIPKILSLSWPKACAVAVFLFLIFITVIGNTLVMLSILTTRRLRTVTNYFVMNLAVTDWLVGIFVMPPAVVLYIGGSWQFGWVLCDIWISLDVLLCTASILSLCAISLDRYLAVIQPLTYSKKRRSKRLALFMIFVVWVVALAITCPPFFGWYEPGRRKSDSVDCRYNQNKGYVVFSAMGSFFIPLIVMLYVYLKIGYVLTSRRQRMTLTENFGDWLVKVMVLVEKVANEIITAAMRVSQETVFTPAAQKASEKSPDTDVDVENFVTETEHVQCSPKRSTSFRNFKTKSFDQATLYELVEISRSSSTIRCSTISCKYATHHATLPLHAIHFCQNHTSFSESSLSTSKLRIQQHPNKCHRIPMRISTLKRDTKTAKTLTMVMGGFIACWLPFFIYYILIPFLPKEAVSEAWMSFLTWVGWVNCAINPFIYAFYSADFRAAFWRLTCRRICKRPNHTKIFKG